MNEFSLIMGGAMLALILINFFVRSWFLCLAIVILGVGSIVTMAKPLNVYLVCAVGVVVIGEVVMLIASRFKDA